MPMDMKKANSQPKLEVIWEFKVIAANHPLPHIYAPLAHDIVADEGCVDSLHIKVEGLEYGIVHVLLPSKRFSLIVHMPTNIGTYASPF